MSEPPSALPPSRAQHKKMAELEHELLQLRQRVEGLSAERDAAVSKYTDLERALTATLAREAGESLLHLVQRLRQERDDARGREAAAVAAQTARDQRRARWQELVHRTLPLTGVVTEKNAAAAMALAASCADQLLREEEMRFTPGTDVFPGSAR